MKYKLPDVGDDLFIENEIRTVIEIFKNMNNDKHIRWKSKRGEGVCHPTVWEGWINNITTEDRKK